MLTRLRELIEDRPLTALGVAVVLSLLIGVGIGLGDPGREAELEDELAEVQEERDDLTSELEDVESELDIAEANLGQVAGALDRSKADARRAEARAAQAQDEAAAAEEADAASGGLGETYTVGDFTMSDVQVMEDGLGDFEVRVRVTNNGEAADFVAVQATIFEGGTVVSDAENIADFAADQTRTMTLISTDKYGPWEEIEFTVDVGF